MNTAPPTTARLLPVAPWVVLGLGLGLAVAILPTRWSLAALGGALVLALTLWRPLIGVLLAVGLGVTKAFLTRLGYGGFLFDFGQIFLALTLVGWIGRKLLTRDLTLPLPVLLVFVVLYAVVGAASLIGAASYEDGLPELLKWLQIAAVVVIVVDEGRVVDPRWLVAGLCALAVLQGGLGVLQYVGRAAAFGFPPDLLETFLVAPGRYRALGTFEQPNPYAGFLGLVWPVAAGAALGLAGEAWSRWRARGRLTLSAADLALFGLAVAGAGAGLAGIGASVSRGGLIGAVAAAGLMAVFLPRRLGWSLGAVAAVVAVGALALSLNLLPASIAARLASATDFIGVQDVRGVTITNDNFAVVERLAHWQAALSMIEAHPWLGVGLGNYAAAYEQYRLLNWPNALGHAHNIYLNIWAETGLFGLVTYFALWAAVVWFTIRMIRLTHGLERGVLIGLLGAWGHLSLHQLFDNLYVNNIHLLLAALLGLLAYFHGKQRTTS